VTAAKRSSRRSPAWLPNELFLKFRRWPSGEGVTPGRVTRLRFPGCRGRVAEFRCLRPSAQLRRPPSNECTALRAVTLGSRDLFGSSRPVADSQTFAPKVVAGSTRRDRGAHVFVRKSRWLARCDAGCSNRPAGGPNALLVLQQGVEEEGPRQPRASIVGRCRRGQSSRSAVGDLQGPDDPTVAAVARRQVIR
jgi:hypothetical protein